MFHGAFACLGESRGIVWGKALAGLGHAGPCMAVRSEEWHGRFNECGSELRGQLPHAPLKVLDLFNEAREAYEKTLP